MSEKTKTSKLSGWGRFEPVETHLQAPRDEQALRAAVLAAGTVIARGNGRAYGDSAVNPGVTLSTRHFNRMLRFDPDSGVLEAEAGVVLGDVIAAFLPRGWFPAVTPGTKFVTLGGMIAADVHGKNHHKDGSFASCVLWIDVMGPDGQVRRASRDENTGLFEHTLGGMGLTGIILRCAFRLRPVESGWIAQETKVAPDLKTAMALFEEAADTTYSVAWIDCLSTGASLGRSLVMLGEHATLDDLSAAQRKDPLRLPEKSKKTVPFDFPSMALNRYTVKAFNALYYRMGRSKPSRALVDWDSYFYPLDAILGWNRIYGRKGFMQFQCALPLDRSEAGLTRLLETIADMGAGSFLAVLKRFGPQDSRFSFPMEGYTLALDFPATRRTRVLMHALDKITLDHGGRFYLAKDSRMSAQTLHSADPRSLDFAQARSENGWADGFSSSQAERLKL